MDRVHKAEGFPGQRIVVLPRPVVAEALSRPLTAGLVPTDIGFFPHADDHFRERSDGAREAIFILCTRGRGWCELGGRTHQTGPGELLVVPPETPHIYGADESQPWTIFWFHARGTQLEAYLQELSASAEQPVKKIGDSPQAIALFEELLDVLERGYSRLDMLCAAKALSHLMTVLIREQKGGGQESSSRQRITRTIDYMQQHLDQALQLDALASIAGLSRSRFVEIFKQECGYAPIDYFIRLKMHRACQLLDTTDQSVKAIAAALGYDDPLYFSRLFRSVNERSPTQHRQQRKG